MVASLGCLLDTEWKMEAPLKNCLHQSGLWTCLGSIVFIASLCRRDHPTLRNANPGQVGLSHIRKPGETSQVSSDPPWSLLQFLLWLPSIMDYNLEPFLPSDSLGQCFTKVNRKADRLGTAMLSLIQWNKGVYEVSQSDLCIFEQRCKKINSSKVLLYLYPNTLIRFLKVCSEWCLCCS